ncbi:MAG: hypothetical protein IJP31_11895 [Lachnospiraceae bacterium]|nr:hypothetical protein [Lachnospiraceae bacterium]
MREKIIAICFLIIIFVIPLSTIGKKLISTSDHTFSDSTSVSESVFHDEQEVNTTDASTFTDYVERFTDDLILIEDAAKVTHTLAAALSDDAYIDSDQVLAGKGGWLFYKRADDGTSLQDYQGISIFSEDTLEKISKSLIQQRDAFQDRGIRFAVMIIPNKEIVYEDYMPSTITRISEETRCDILVKYLTDNTDLEIIYPKEDLINAKYHNQIYYKYDTHWNRIGAHIGVQSILKKLYGTYQDISDTKIIIENQNKSGDLASLINMQEKYCDDTEYSLDISSYDPKQIVNDKLLIIGDSFCDMMLDDLDYYFEEVYPVGVWSFKMSMLDTYQPDIVIWECVERYADRLNWINLVK